MHKLQNNSPAISQLYHPILHHYWDTQLSTFQSTADKKKMQQTKLLKNIMNKKIRIEYSICLIFSPFLLVIYLLKFANKTFNKMGGCTINSNSIHFVTLIYCIKALLETLSGCGILAIHRAEANPRWNVNVFFFKQLNTGLKIVIHMLSDTK